MTNHVQCGDLGQRAPAQQVDSGITDVLKYIFFCFFNIFFNDTATTEIYTLSLHDALPIFDARDTK